MSAGQKDGEKKVEAEAPKKTAEENMIEAAGRFKKVTDVVQSPELAKLFFESYGTEGLAPKKDKDPAAAYKDLVEKSGAQAKQMLADQKALIDTTISDRSKFEIGLPGRPPGYGANYLTQDWSIKNFAGVDNPNNTKSECMENNCRIQQDFQRMGPFELIPSRAQKVPESVPFVPPEGLRIYVNEVKPTPANVMKGDPFLVPYFEVLDSASINITETNSQMERSMAYSGFSSQSVQASVSGSYLGFSASASGGFTKQSQDNKSLSTLSDRKEYNAVYNFPRVRIRFDSLDIRVTKDCEALLLQIRAASDNLQKQRNSNDPNALDSAVTEAVYLLALFHTRYGHIFSMSLQLGGQLIASRSADSFAEVSESSKRDALKAAAAVSVGFGGGKGSISASASYSQENQTSLQNKSGNVVNNSALAWSARGGNTLLAATPAEWANSVAGFQTWRTIEQDEVLPIGKVLATLFKETETVANNINTIRPWRDMPDIFEMISQSSYKAAPADSLGPPIAAPAPGGTTGPAVSPAPASEQPIKFRLEPVQGGRIYFDEKHALQYDRNNSGTSLTFTPLDAGWEARKTDMPTFKDALLADWPLFLVSVGSPNRVKKDEGDDPQIQGLWVQDGSPYSEKRPNAKLCRWSLRKSSVPMDLANPWKPDKANNIIKNSDEVVLYCHSYNSGQYNSISKANDLYWAPPLALRDTGILGIASLPVNVITGITANFSNADERLNDLENNTFQAAIERADRFKDNLKDQAQIKLYNKLFGIRNSANWSSIGDKISDLSKKGSIVATHESVINSIGLGNVLKFRIIMV